MVAWLMDQLITWIAEFILLSIDTLAAVMGNTVNRVPDITLIPQVQAIWSTNVAIANTCYALALLAGAVIVMGYETVQTRYEIKDLAPRLVFGFIAANFSKDWAAMIFLYANRFLETLTGQGTGTGQPTAVHVVRQHVTGALDSLTGALLLIVIALLILVLIAALLFTFIARFGLFIVLCVAAPLALACHCLPQCEPVAKMWWRAFFGALATQVLQALTLHTGLRVFLDPNSQIPQRLGMGGGALINLAVLAVLLYTAVKIPGLMRRYTMRAGGGGGLGILRVVVVQQITRGLRGGRALTTGGGR